MLCRSVYWSVHDALTKNINRQISSKFKKIWYLRNYLVKLSNISILRVEKQGRIHGSISRVRVGRGSMVAGQRQKLKSALLLALNAQKREVITDGLTDGSTDSDV